MSIGAKVYSWWDKHGTKIIGYASTISGLFGSVDPKALDALFGNRTAAIMLALAGAVTAYRGHRNSKKSPPSTGP